MIDETVITQPLVNRVLRILATILSHIGPIVLALCAGYGAVKYTEGATQQRLQTLESDSRSQKEEQQRDRDRMVTQNEFILIREQLGEIQKDVRGIRSDLTRGKLSP